MLENIRFALSIKDKWANFQSKINTAFKRAKQDIVTNRREIILNRNELLLHRQTIQDLVSKVSNLQSRIQIVNILSEKQKTLESGLSELVDIVSKQSEELLEPHYQEPGVSEPRETIEITPEITKNLPFEPGLSPSIAYPSLTNPEKEVINTLFNTDTPLSYEGIGGKLGKSANSIKVYINSLKNKGYPLEENLGPKGIKLYAIKHAEKVRKLYGKVQSKLKRS